MRMMIRGDGGLATGASLSFPTGVFVDSSGNIFISDTFNNHIREVVAATGNIRTVAGNGTNGFSGDGGPATSAELDFPIGTFVDPSGNIFTVDGNRVREVDAAAGNIQTVAGNGTFAFSGDGGPATSAGIGPASAYADSAGNIMITDSANSRVGKLLRPQGIFKPSPGMEPLASVGMAAQPPGQRSVTPTVCLVTLLGTSSLLTRVTNASGKSLRPQGIFRLWLGMGSLRLVETVAQPLAPGWTPPTVCL